MADRLLSSPHSPGASYPLWMYLCWDPASDSGPGMRSKSSRSTREVSTVGDVRLVSGRHTRESANETSPAVRDRRPQVDLGAQWIEDGPDHQAAVLSKPKNTFNGAFAVDLSR